MIVAHHAGEDVLYYVAANGAAAGSVVLAVCRARISRFVNRIRRR